LTAETIRELARECGFELAGVAAARPGPEGTPERAWYHEWVASGFAGEMRYLTGHGAAARDDPRNLLASARSVVCVGKLYNTPWPYSTQFDAGERAWISRYAWGEDYHGVVRRGLERLAPAYPPKRPLTDWEPPKPRRLGCRPLTAAQLRDIARGEDELPAWLARPKGKKT